MLGPMPVTYIQTMRQRERFHYRFRAGIRLSFVSCSRSVNRLTSTITDRATDLGETIWRKRCINDL